MYRPDIIELVRGATERGIRSVMAPCGTMVNKESLSALKAAGVTACSFSVDGATAQSHDAFRGVVGAFDNIIRAMRVAADIGMPFQINTTVSKLNLDELPAVRELAMQLGAIMHDLFFLVPVGRGKGVGELALSAGQTEKALRWMFEMNQQGPIAMRETCAPQAVRIWDNLGRPGKKTSGCMGGKGFVFISHRGTMQPCGFLDVDSGNLRDFDFDFASAYRNSKVFSDLQRCDSFADGCGDCSFNYDCSGCRARAYAVAGDYMAADPSCPIANAKHKR